MKYQAIEEHKPDNSNPIKVRKGETVRLGRKSDEEDGWTDWIYCYSLEGNSEGWTPEQIIQTENEFGIILDDYSAEELRVSKGDIVDGELELNGWLWCSRFNDCEVGWLPKEKIMPLISEGESYMKTLKKPNRLNPGDKVALVSLSWGGAGDAEILWRYKQGKERLEKVFSLEVVEMKHTLSGTEYIYNHPEKRAEDLMEAFKDDSIKGIICCIGGNESIRMLPYIDFEVINKNPKIFMGYSDTTTTHLFCYRAGISSIYGPSLLVDFAENVSMNPYTVEHLEKTLFNPEIIGRIEPAREWTSEYLPWEEKNRLIQRRYRPNRGYELLQGRGKVQGRLLGGCFEVFDMLRGTEIFPKPEDFDDAILFLETSEDKPPAWFVECGLRNYAINGILDKVKGIIWGKPQDEENFEEYKGAIRKVMKECGKEDLPVLYNMNFGHTEPKICLPYGALAEIDCDNTSFSILESAVL